MTAAFLTAAEVAARLGRSADWFAAHKDALIARHGFPPADAAFANRWSSLAVEAWELSRVPEHLRPFASRGPQGHAAGPDLPDADPAAAALIAAEQAELDRRSLALADAAAGARRQ